MTVVGIPSTRVSDSYIRQRLLSQIRYSQVQLLDAQLEISTGHTFQLPSETPQAAARVMSLQRLLERKEQVSTNISTTQSYLSMADSAMSDANSILANIKALVSSVIGTTASDEDRAAAVTEIQETINSLLNIANQQYRGRYLFSGSLTSIAAFSLGDNNTIAYNGNDLHLQSYVDINLLFNTNYTGDEVFGAISKAAEGTADLTPAMDYDTRLSDLRGGEGITRGSFAISCGGTTVEVDISGCETIGEVAAKIQEAEFGGQPLEAEVSPRGLVIRCNTGQLLIRDLSGGTTAAELGIVEQSASAEIEGEALDPVLRTTSSLDDVLGTKAKAFVRSAKADANVLFTARSNGTGYNGWTISYVADPDVIAGEETVEVVGNAIRVHIAEGSTTAADVVDAVHTAYEEGDVDFDARLDPMDPVGTGLGLVASGDSASSEYGSGRSLDTTSGLQILNGGETHIITFEDCSTVEDMLNKLNTSSAGVVAGINSDGTGINIQSLLSGCDFTIAENGGTTAADLGVCTFTGDTRLEDLNYEFELLTDTDFEAGTDFTITRADGVTLDIDLYGMVDIQDVLNQINNHTDNTGTHRLTAQLRNDGNGIELVDDSFGEGTLEVSLENGSQAAVALGLVSSGESSAGPTTAGSVATATIDFSGSGNTITFNSLGTGTSCNGTVVTIEDCGSDPEALVYNDSIDPPTLTFRVDYDTATAQTIVDLLANHPQASLRYEAVLGSDGGDGSVGDATTTLEDGSAAVLDGSDPNPQEVEGVFTALLRLKTAVESNDTVGMERGVAMLESAYAQLTLIRGELGARQQTLDALTDRQAAELIDLKSNMSDDYDVDLVEAASNYSARQIAYEAALKATSLIYRMTLLDYL